jgi:hypothetical protein
MELSFADSSQNPDTRYPVKFANELIDLAIRGLNLALRVGFLL